MNAQLLEQNTRKRLLLIEDDKSNRQMMSDYFAYFGYSILSLPDGSKFFEALATFEPHLILLDLRLADIDGYTLLEQVKQKPEWLAIPIFIVSAYAFQADQRRALGLGASRYFVKPVNLNHLKQAIDEELSYLLS